MLSALSFLYRSRNQYLSVLLPNVGLVPKVHSEYSKLKLWPSEVGEWIGFAALEGLPLYGDSEPLLTYATME